MLSTGVPLVSTKDGIVQTAKIPQTGFVRLGQILAVIPVSKSTWWAGVKSGRYPQPTHALGERITAWSASDIHKLIERAAPKAAA